MHFIQRIILDRLLYAQTLRYAELRPDGIESNHFAYHLNQMVKNGYVEKVDGGYTLASAGLAHVDRLSHQKMKERKQPNIVTMIDVTNSAGDTLLFKRSYQPYIYKIGFPSGKIHMDERIGEAAQRELKEKSGLTNVALNHKGVVYLEVKKQDFVISKVMAHVFSGKSDQTPESPAGRGECFWAKPPSKVNELMPAFDQIKKLIKTRTDKFFFEELNITLTD